MWRSFGIRQEWLRACAAGGVDQYGRGDPGRLRAYMAVWLSKGCTGGELLDDPRVPFGPRLSQLSMRANAGAGAQSLSHRPCARESAAVWLCAGVWFSTSCPQPALPCTPSIVAELRASTECCSSRQFCHVFGVIGSARTRPAPLIGAQLCGRSTPRPIVVASISCVGRPHIFRQEASRGVGDGSASARVTFLACIRPSRPLSHLPCSEPYPLEGRHVCAWAHNSERCCPREFLPRLCA